MHPKRIFAWLFVLMFSFFSVQGQDFDTDYDINPEYGLTVKISPQHFFWGGLPLVGEYGVYIERRITQKSAVEGGLAYLGKGLMLLSMEAEESYNSNNRILGMSGFRVQGAYKFYINQKEKNTGFYAAPHFSFASAKYFEKYVGGTSANQAFIQAMHTDFSGILGIRWVFGRFSMETFAGAGYRNKHWLTKDYTGVSTLSEEEFRDLYIITEPIVIKMGFKIGLQI